VQAEHMGKKIVITPSSFGKVNSDALDLLKQNFSDIKINDTGKKIPDYEVINFYKDADYAIAGLELLNSNILKYLPQLKVISRVGIGLDNIDLEYANNNNIKVVNTPDPPTEAVSEITITAALSLSRNLFNYNKDLHASQWTKSVSSSLKNKNILIIGFGRIGQKVGEYFNFFQSNVHYYDPYIDSKNINTTFKKVDFEKGLLNADIISIHSSSPSELIGNKEFKLMKDGVIILNSSRGYHVNELELIKNLKTKKVGSCWLDVFEEEPYQGDLINLDNAILTPHISTYTEICRQDMEMEAVKNLLNEI
jgi:D-3-phosphoglycerate dehydrogenase / 2-oxoglutarate reductase